MARKFCIECGKPGYKFYQYCLDHMPVTNRQKQVDSRKAKTGKTNYSEKEKSEHYRQIADGKKKAKCSCQQAYAKGQNDARNALRQYFPKKK